MILRRFAEVWGVLQKCSPDRGYEQEDSENFDVTIFVRENAGDDTFDEVFSEVHHSKEDALAVANEFLREGGLDPDEVEIYEREDNEE